MKVCIIVLGLVVAMAAASPVRKSNEKPSRKRRDVGDFHRNFLREEKALQQMGSQCGYNEFLDLELMTCKGCEKFCSNNQCGECAEYYLTKTSDEFKRAMNVELGRRDMFEIGQWVCIGFLMMWAVAATATIAWLVRRLNSETERLYVAADTQAHDLDCQDLEAEKPEGAGEPYCGIVKANSKVTGDDNRTDEKQVVDRANAPLQVCQPHEDGKCDTLMS